MSYVEFIDYKSEILSKVSEEDLFKQYVVSNFEIGKLFSSPFRSDKTPSAIITRFNDRLVFQDFGDKTYKGDIFSVLSKFWNMSFAETVKKIYFDLKLYNNENKVKIMKPTIDLESVSDAPASKTIITTEIRKWYLRDRTYWETNYQTSLKELQDNDIYPLKSFTITNDRGSWTFDVDNSFVYGLKNENEWKIYQPLNDVKWTSNIPNSRLEWYKNGNDKILIITKSRKDKIILDRLIDCHKLVVQNEKVDLSEEDITYIRHKYELIIIIYDNDETGNACSKALEDKLIFPHYKNVYNISDKLEFNDSGEYAKNKATVRLKSLIDDIVSNFDFLPF